MPIVFMKDGKPLPDLAAAFKNEDGSYQTLKAGEKRDQVIQVRNDYEGDAVRIKANLSGDPDMKLVNYPNSLKFGETGEILIHFAPSTSRQKGFHGTIDWEVDVL